MSAGGPQPGIAEHAECTCVPNYKVDGSVEHMQTCPRSWLGRRVEVGQRSSNEILASLAMLAEEQLAELKHLVARASAGESRSSASVKDSTRGYDLEVKSYADGLLEDAVVDAIEAYRRGRLKLAELQANQWRDTVDELRAQLDEDHERAMADVGPA